MPLVGQAGAGARGTPSEVTKQPATQVIPLPTMGQTKRLTTLVAPTTVGVTPPVEAPPTQVEVAAAVIGETQPNATVVVPKTAA